MIRLTRLSIIHERLHKTNLRHFCGSSDNQNPTKNTSILESTSLQHWFKNWQEKRENKLTASTFAGAIGFWRKRRAQLWLEKIGAVKPFMGNVATAWGNIKEEEALERYKLITGNTVLFPQFQVHGSKIKDEEWIGCSPDGIVDRVVYGLPSRGVLEIKCPYFDGDREKMYPWSRIPLCCVPQAQGLMEILDRDWMDFYCWTVNGSSLFRIYRDRDYWELMRVALSDFWTMNVVPARELYRIYPIKDPFFEMRSLRPAPRHELCPTIVLASKYIVKDSELRIREIHGRLQHERSQGYSSLIYDPAQTQEFELQEMERQDLGVTEEMWG